MERHVTVDAIRDDLSFGARVHGVTLDLLGDPDVRERLSQAFEQRGLLIFEDVDPTPEMQVAISNVFGPLKDHPVASVERVDQATMPGVIVISTEGGGAKVEVDGRPLVTWQPWHFDHCYNSELNYAGVLRTVVRPRHRSTYRGPRRRCPASDRGP